MTEEKKVEPVAPATETPVVATPEKHEEKKDQK